MDVQIILLFVIFTNMEIIARYIFGSGNSLDRDILYIVDNLPGSIKECKDFCNDHSIGNDNPNIATISDGHIESVFKGTVDELNNALLRTYMLHDQEYPLLVDKVMDRDVYLKCIRSVRVILSHLSRSCYRVIIKEALRSGWGKRLDVLCDICRSNDDIDFSLLNKNMSGRDIMKLIAFQIGQCTALVYGWELYTKDEVCEVFPNLAKYIRRKSDDWDFLKSVMFDFVVLLKDIDYIDCGENKVQFGDRVYDLKMEKSV